MALTPDQEKLKEAALAASHSDSFTEMRYRNFIGFAMPERVLAILAQLEQVQGWVSVDNRLPEKYEHVLAYGAKRCEWAVMRYDENGSKAWEIETTSEFASAYPPKFWQPLPPPPEAA